MKQVHAIIRGRVQGVGFRWEVVDLAEHYHLTGTTKNLPDGTVEVNAQGSQESLDAFIAALEKGPGSAHVESVHTEFYEPKTSFKGFRIVD